MADAGDAGDASDAAQFQPTDVPGLTVWLRADKGIVQVGSNVGGWGDQSGLGNSFVQTSPNNQPGFVASGVSGLPAVSFAGVDDWLDGPPTSAFLTSTDYTLGIVVLVSAVASNDPITYENDAIMADRGAYFGVHLRGTPPKAFAFNYDGDSDFVGSDLTLDTPTLLWQYHTAGGLFLRIGSALPVSVPSGSTQSVSEPAIIGAKYTRAGGFFNGRVAEIVIYNHALSAKEAADVRAYLANRYGIPGG